MAAIDKLYVHSYYDYDMLRKWALVYYPELLFYFCSYSLSYNEYIENMNEWVKHEKAIIERDFARLGYFTTDEEAIQNVIKHYKETADYDCPKAQATEEVEYCLEQYNKMINGTLEDDYSFPVMNTPLDVDIKLKWICPVPCVRKYLETCGIKTKWYHKLFWKGKKHFYLVL